MTDTWRQYTETEPEPGDTRHREVYFKKGAGLGRHTKENRNYIAKYNLYCEVTEIWDGNSWGKKTWHLDTIRPAPSRWQRLKNWLTYPKTNLPKATVL